VYPQNAFQEMPFSLKKLQIHDTKTKKTITCIVQSIAKLQAVPEQLVNSPLVP
jgi:hypothetical protein